MYESQHRRLDESRQKYLTYGICEFFQGLPENGYAKKRVDGRWEHYPCDYIRLSLQVKTHKKDLRGVPTSPDNIGIDIEANKFISGVMEACWDEFKNDKSQDVSNFEKEISQSQKLLSLKSMFNIGSTLSRSVLYNVILK